MNRIIAHIDLDCFYCQVEHLRLQIPMDVPLAVQQWQGLIAVNYAARANGVQRHCNVFEAKKLCPTIKFAHVPTYSGDAEGSTYVNNPHPSKHKSSLEPYRKASNEIFKIFCKNIQKASIDEAYLDISEEVADFEEENSTGVVIGDVPLDCLHERASKFVAKIRATIFQELSFTCSAGIACNKTLAKICSGMNKPNNQTILMPLQIASFMDLLPLTKIKTLGGKLGNQIQECFQVQFAGELMRFSMNELVEILGDATAERVYNLVRGIDDDPAKAFPKPIADLEALDYWINIFCKELKERSEVEYDLSNRCARTITVQWTTFGHTQSKSGPVSLNPSCKTLKSKVVDVLQKIEQFERVAVTLSNFEKVGGINGFFKKVTREEKIRSMATVVQTKREVCLSDENDLAQETKPRKRKHSNASSKEQAWIPLDSFLKRRPSECGEALKEDHVRCPECRKAIHNDEIQIHADMHFARRLAKQQ